MRILGIETSCDETGIAVFDTEKQKMLAHSLYSQIAAHQKYGGVVPEIASRSQLEKIREITDHALNQASLSLSDIDCIAVTNKPGLAGSLLVGVCFAKGLTWSLKKPIIGVNHLEGHVFSPFIKEDGSIQENIPFPHISITASGGHTALYLVHGFGLFEQIAHTQDDAAGEAFDKIAKLLGFGYPGGALIEKLSKEVNFVDFFNYPRTKNKKGELFFSFSGLKTAVLYHLVREQLYDLKTGTYLQPLTHEFCCQVASSLLVCINHIFMNNIICAFKKYPTVKALTFGGGVACNRYMQTQFHTLCQKLNKQFYVPGNSFCTDNGGMIAFVGGYQAQAGKFDSLSLDIKS